MEQRGMVLLSGNSHPDLADLVSRHLDSRLGNSSVRNKVSWSWLTKVSQKITILWNNVKTNTICLISIFHLYEDKYFAISLRIICMYMLYTKRYPKICNFSFTIENANSLDVRIQDT